MLETKDRLVIVGAGIAGVSAAGAARQAGFAGEIVVVGEEPEAPYRRPPVSKEVLRGDKGADQIRIRKPDWFVEHDIGVRIGESVTAIDTEAKQAAFATGERLRYDSLILATGGTPRKLKSINTGAGDDVVHTLRTLADAEALRPALIAGGHLLVIGAGLIGAEIAASAREQRCDVTMLDAAELPLAQLVPPAIGEMYRDLHRSRGVDLHLGVTITSVDANDRRAVVRATDGRQWSGNLAVMAVGMAPASGLARAASIATDETGAIRVDEFGATSIADIYAAGDVALVPSRIGGTPHRIEHWQGAQNHGAAIGAAVAARSKGETPQAFDEVPWCWSEQYGLNLQVTGWPSAEHEIVVRGSMDNHDFTAVFLRNAVIRGAVTLGRPADIRFARRWIAEGRKFDSRELAVAPDLASLGVAVA